MNQADASTEPEFQTFEIQARPYAGTTPGKYRFPSETGNYACLLSHEDFRQSWLVTSQSTKLSPSGKKGSLNAENTKIGSKAPVGHADSDNLRERHRRQRRAGYTENIRGHVHRPDDY
jgi:hypothetical protein